MHHQFLHHCLKLAENGRGQIQTNPLVGCVITDGDEVIAEGWHEKFGEEHAEVIALNVLRTTYYEPDNLTLYVNLEPCCTTRKQSPCTDTIIQSGIKRVVFGASDPSNPGADILRSNGIEVIGPVMEAQCRRLNKGFFSLIENNRPYVTLKKAMRTDGSVDGKITTEEQDIWSHTRLRATHDAILVGSGTIIEDDPQLNIRFSVAPPSPHAQYNKQNTNSKPQTESPCGEGGRGGGVFQPKRIILDPHSKLPSDSTVLTDSYADRTLVITEHLSIDALLDHLKAEGIASVLVEGGPSIWKSFEESGLIDELVILTGK